MHLMKINENVEIKELTTMRLGGLARYVIELETVEDVEKAYLFAKERQEVMSLGKMKVSRGLFF